jgi:hypothetical protein
MDARLRKLLLVLFMIVPALLGVPPTATPDVLAEDSCPAGTHWDDGLQRCVSN